MNQKIKSVILDNEKNSAKLKRAGALAFKLKRALYYEKNVNDADKKTLSNILKRYSYDIDQLIADAEKNMPEKMELDKYMKRVAIRYGLTDKEGVSPVYEANKAYLDYLANLGLFPQLIVDQIDTMEITFGDQARGFNFERNYDARLVRLVMDKMSKLGIRKTIHKNQDDNPDNDLKAVEYIVSLYGGKVPENPTATKGIFWNNVEFNIGYIHNIFNAIHANRINLPSGYIDSLQKDWIGKAGAKVKRFKEFKNAKEGYDNFFGIEAALDVYFQEYMKKMNYVGNDGTKLSTGPEYLGKAIGGTARIEGIAAPSIIVNHSHLINKLGLEYTGFWRNHDNIPEWVNDFLIEGSTLGIEVGHMNQGASMGGTLLGVGYLARGVKDWKQTSGMWKGKSEVHTHTEVDGPNLFNKMYSGKWPAVTGAILLDLATGGARYWALGQEQDIKVEGNIFYDDDRTQTQIIVNPEYTIKWYRDRIGATIGGNFAVLENRRDKESGFMDGRGSYYLLLHYNIGRNDGKK